MLDPCIKHVTASLGQSKKYKNDFLWRDDSNIPPLEDASPASHLGLLKKYKIPFVTDIHCHFFPEHIFKLIWRYFDHSYWPIAYRQPLEERLQALRRNQFTWFTTLNYAHKPGMAEMLNDWVAASHRQWPGALPFGTFYPEEGAIDYVHKAVEEYGFRGFKLHCQVSDIELDSSQLREVFAYLQQKQLPLVIHTGTAPTDGPYVGLQYFKPLVKRFNQLKIIIAHMGAYEMHEYFDLALEYDTLYLDTTMILVDYIFRDYDRQKLLERIDKFSEKVFFGSDFPNIPYNLAHPVESILNSSLSVEAKQNIIFKNFMKLFDLPLPVKEG